MCWNSAKTIERTIQSVLAQDYPHVEYVIVDGGSTDGTSDIIERYRSRIHTFISEKDHGLYDAMNKGVALATGEWIHLLNSDDHYVDNKALSAIVKKLKPNRTNYSVVLREYAGVIGSACRFPYRRWKLHISAKLPHPGMIISREQYQKIGKYDADLRIAADHDFILRMLKHYPANFIDLPLVAMDQGGVSATNLELSYREFMQVSVRHGTPKILARLVYWLKRVRWRV